MITADRWQHILGVARKAKALALKLRPDNPRFAEDMFVLGLLHDFGYEFIEANQGHAQVGGEILQRSGYKYWREVALHGDESVLDMSDELFVLNCADMTTGPKGEDFTFEERVAEIGARFGLDSAPYQKAAKEAEILQNHPLYQKIK